MKYTEMQENVNYVGNDGRLYMTRGKNSPLGAGYFSWCRTEGSCKVKSIEILEALELELL